MSQTKHATHELMSLGTSNIWVIHEIYHPQIKMIPQWSTFPPLKLLDDIFQNEKTMYQDSWFCITGHRADTGSSEKKETYH